MMDIRSVRIIPKGGKHEKQALEIIKLLGRCWEEHGEHSVHHPYYPIVMECKDMFEIRWSL